MVNIVNNVRSFNDCNCLFRGTFFSNLFFQLSSPQLLYLSHCFNELNENLILLWLRLIWDGKYSFLLIIRKKKIQIKFNINDLNSLIAFNACPGFSK